MKKLSARVRDAHNLLVAHTKSPSYQNFIPTMSLELSWCFLPNEVTSGSDGWTVYYQWIFFFPFFSLFSHSKSRWPFKISKLSSYLFAFQLRSLFFLFLIFILDSLIKVWFVFDFVFQLSYVIFFNLVLFFYPFVKLIFLLNKKLVVVL
jgi:hypothetical protein